MMNDAAKRMLEVEEGGDVLFTELQPFVELVVSEKAGKAELVGLAGKVAAVVDDGVANSTRSLQSDAGMIEFGRFNPHHLAQAASAVPVPAIE